jgi:predicted transcriptional regulator
LEEQERSQSKTDYPYDVITNVLKAVQLSAVGSRPATIDLVISHLNPAIERDNLQPILKFLVDEGLTVLEEKSQDYYITDGGRRLLIIGP